MPHHRASEVDHRLAKLSKKRGQFLSIQCGHHLKKAIMDPKMLEFVNYDYPLRVKTDVSVDRCRAMLL